MSVVCTQPEALTAAQLATHARSYAATEAANAIAAG